MVRISKMFLNTFDGNSQSPFIILGAKRKYFFANACPFKTKKFHTKYEKSDPAQYFVRARNALNAILLEYFRYFFVER